MPNAIYTSRGQRSSVEIERCRPPPPSPPPRRPRPVVRALLLPAPTAALRCATAARPVPNQKSVAQRNARHALAVRVKASSAGTCTASVQDGCQGVVHVVQPRSRPTKPRAGQPGQQMQAIPSTMEILRRPRHTPAPQQTMVPPRYSYRLHLRRHSRPGGHNAAPVPTTASTRSRRTWMHPTPCPQTSSHPSISTIVARLMAYGTTVSTRSPLSMRPCIPISWTGTPLLRPWRQAYRSTLPWAWIC